MADIFISYTSSDKAWAFWLGKELEALGHVPHVHEWEIAAGADIYAWMERTHHGADHVLCVVSDDYLDHLKAPFSALERNAALWQAASKRPRFALFVVVKACKLPTLTDHLRRCEVHDVPEAVARERFKAYMTAPAAPATASFPGKSVAVSNIPINVPLHFMGRDAPLAAIAAALARYEGRVAITALHGLRGVGKTTLAAAYAERHAAAYRATWWIRAQTEATMRADMVALGVRLGWVEPDAKEEPALAAVAERLRHEGEGILLIYDNAIDAAGLKPYLPRGGGARVLVTSNAHNWRGLAEPVEIRLWPTAVGADYLIARTGRKAERAAAEALSDALGGLPLAHEQAAAYCERLDVGLAEYARRFAAAPARFLDDARHAPKEHNDGLTVAKSFALAIEEAAKLHPAAEPLIVHAALLAPEPIPLFLFVEGREHLGEPLASLLADDGLDEAVAALRAFALVDREAIPDERDPAITTECIRLHRLVREVAAEQGAIVARDDKRHSLIGALRAVYPDNVIRAPAAWPTARRLDALALAAVAADVALPAGAAQAAGRLLDRLASYRQGALAAYLEAQSLFERALIIHEETLGPDHTDTSSSLNNLAYLLQDKGDLARARPLHERALAIREKALGPDHPHTATSLNNLALLLQEQGDLAGARPLYERALAIHEKALGPDHPQTALSLNNLAYLLQALGDLAGARVLLDRDLAIIEKTLGSDHPDTATSLNNLAYLLQAQGDLAGARPLLERAIEIGEKTLGHDHPDVATRYSNLGRLLREAGEVTEAEALFAKAIEIGDKALGTNHSLTQRYRSHFASLLLDTGRASAARDMGQTALAVHETQNSPAHPWTQDSARVTADALDALGEAEKAAEVRARYGV